MGGHDIVSATTARIGAVRAGGSVRVASIRAMVNLRVDWAAGTGRVDHAGAVEISRPPGGSHTGHATVFRSEL